MHKDVKKGDKVLFDDGKLVASVKTVQDGFLTDETINNHSLKKKKI